MPTKSQQSALKSGYITKKQYDKLPSKMLGKKGGGRVTIPNLQKMLRQTFKVPAEPGAGTQEQPFLVSKGVIRYCMVHQLGYHWGRIRLKKNTADSNRPAMVRSYLCRCPRARAPGRRSDLLL